VRLPCLLNIGDGLLLDESQLGFSRALLRQRLYNCDLLVIVGKQWNLYCDAN